MRPSPRKRVARLSMKKSPQLANHILVTVTEPAFDLRSSASLLRLAPPPTRSTMNWGANGKFTATAINHIWEEHVKKEQLSLIHI